MIASLLVLGASLLPPADAAASDVGWDITSVDSVNYVGDVSMDVDSQGYVHIAYIDDVDRHALYARETSTGWVFRDLGETNFYGATDGRSRVAISVDSLDVAHVVYSINDNNQLTYYDNAASGSPEVLFMNGISLSMDIGQDGKVHISYVDYYEDGVIYLTKVDTEWVPSGLDYSVNNICTSIVSGDYGTVHIAYVGSSVQELKYAYFDGTGWSFATEPLTHDVDHLSIEVTSGGFPAIAFAFLGTNYDIMFTEFNGLSWNTVTVDTDAMVSVYDAIHMTIDGDGVYHIAYLDKHINALKYASSEGGWTTAAVTASDKAYLCGGITADQYGDIRIAFVDDYQSLLLASGEVASSSPGITSIPVTTGQETIEYEYSLTADQAVTWSLNTNAGFLDLVSGTVSGIPGTDDAGTYYVNVTATNVSTSLSSYQNYTLTIGDSWAPVPDAFPLDGQETAYYEYHPSFNESVMVVYMDTNAPFLELVDEDVKFSFEDKYYAGTPEVGDGGTYWMNITAFSVDGKQPYFMNETFVIEDAYANHITNLPGDGRETLDYEFVPTFDGAMRLIDWHSDADWMLLYGPLDKGPGFPNYWYGAPQVGDAGTYYLNITLQSIGGLLYTTHNFTFTIGEAWAPSLDSAPSNGRVTVPYSFTPTYNESDVITTADTDAPFLTWNGTSGAFEGTPGLGDAGTYWFNMTARSAEGNLTLVSNLSFEILPMPASLRINSDADMLSAVNEFKWAGDGSEEDPFIVTGLLIDSLGSYENSLFIGNVTYHFVITENELGNAGPAGSWNRTTSATLYLFYCGNASVIDNRLWGSNNGLVLANCSGVDIFENLVEQYAYTGIWAIDGCNYLAIENNTLSGAPAFNGIMIQGSSYVRMVNNTMSSNEVGVQVDRYETTHPDTVLVQSNIFDGGVIGVHLLYVHDAMVMNNTIIISSFMAEFALGVSACDNVTLADNTVLGGHIGISIFDSEYIWTENNLISGLNYGIYSEFSSHITMSGDFIQAFMFGLYSYDMTSSTIDGMIIEWADHGIYFESGCVENLVENCEFSGIGMKAVGIYGGMDNIVIDCLMEDFGTAEDTYGVYMESSQGGWIQGCEIIGATYGIYVETSDLGTLDQNTISDCGTGIYASGAILIDIFQNTFYGCDSDIYLFECQAAEVEGNTIYGERTQGSGISLSLCSAVSMYDNSIEDGAILFDIDAGSESVSGHTIDTSNTVGGKPVYYYDYGDYMWSSVPEDGGQIIMVSVSNLHVTGLQTTSCTAPVYIISSLGIRLYGLDLYGSGVGVTMLDSGDIWIVDGRIDSMSVGILGLYVEHLLISGMSMTDNFDAIYVATSEFGPASNIDIEVCRIEGSRNFGVYFDGVGSGSISSSVIANSVSYGLMVTNSQNIMVVENLFYRNNGAGEGYSVPTQVYADSDTNYFDNNGRGNFWSEQLGPDADMDGVVDDLTYPIDGDVATDNYPLAFVFTTDPVTDGRYGIAYEYLPGTDQPASFRLNTNSSFLLIDPMSGRISGTPNACGSFYLHIGATLMGYLDIWQNFTLTVNGTWAPEISGTPDDGKETIDYAYQPTVNETDAIIVADTDAPFLSWNGTALAGTPTVNDAGTYWINITATSVDGLLTSHLNQTFTVEDSWAAQFQSAPGAGKETVYYEHLLRFNESVEVVSSITNAPFLHWSDDVLREPALYPFYNGTPGLNHAGVYWMNITVRSLDGLLESWQNTTFVIDDSWAPEFEDAPKGGQETVEYVYEPKFNESATITGFETNAPFLVWNGSAYVGTPTVEDAGEYWMNITAMSDDGLLESYQNASFVIGESWAPSFENAPDDGQETLDYVYEPQFNETAMVIGHATNAPFLSWNGSAFVGTPGRSDAGTYWTNVTVLSTDGLLESYLNSTFVIDDSWAPEIVSQAVDHGRETLDYVYVPDANETVEWAFDSDAPFLSWNGSAVVGLPDVASSGTYYVNLTATSAAGLLASWQNFTLVVNDTWTAELTNGPSAGQETVNHVFEPAFNETVTDIAADTDAPFLIWNGTAFTGTPGLNDAGTYWMNITATSVNGLLSSSWNQTFIVGEAWAPEMVGAPIMDGRETLDYVYVPEANETVEFEFDSDAPFLSWNGTAVRGVPGLNDAGTYYINMTATSLAGLLSAWQNFTLVVNDTWAPEFLSEPVLEGLFASLEFEYQVEMNESAELHLRTDASFLSIEGGKVAGTMTTGVYYVNITATSAGGLLESWQNFTLTIVTDSTDPGVEITSPADGAKLNDSVASVVWTVSDTGSGLAGLWLKVDDADWTPVNGTQASLTLVEGEHTISVKAKDAVGNEATDTITVSVDLTAPTVLASTPQGLNVSVSAQLSVTFSEAMDADTVAVTVNGVSAEMTWNGSIAVMAGDWDHSTVYTVVVNGADLHGNAMQELSWTFSTEALLVLVSGTLLDADGSPVANATITVNGTVVAVTGTDGSYSFLLPPGNHAAVISAEGYEDAVVDLNLDGEQASLALEMVRADNAPSPYVFYAIIVLVICMVTYVTYRGLKD